jgi:hypothetical protein
MTFVQYYVRIIAYSVTKAIKLFVFLYKEKDQKIPHPLLTEEGGLGGVVAGDYPSQSLRSSLASLA